MSTRKGHVVTCPQAPVSFVRTLPRRDSNAPVPVDAVAQPERDEAVFPATVQARNGAMRALFQSINLIHINAAKRTGL